MTQTFPKATEKTVASSEGPPFRRIESNLRARLQHGEWKEGTLLPSRRMLAQEYGVALRTVERAISGLLTEGLVRAEGRWGTYVNGTPPQGGALAAPGAVREKAASHAILGLLDTNSLDTHAPRFDEYGWLDVIATHAERFFAKTGGTTLYCNHFGTSAERMSVAQALAGLKQEGADALLVIGIFDDALVMQEVTAALENCSVPAVYVSWDTIAGAVPHVFYDNRIAGGQAAQHLKRSGYGDLVYFAPFAAPWAEQRLSGLRQAAEGTVLLSHETQTLDPWIADWDVCRADARALLLRCRMAAQEALPMGIVAANDTLGLILLDAAAELALVPGRDFGLIGFDDQPLSRPRGLTTLHPPLEALGEQAARMLLNRLSGDETQVQMRLRSHLVPRLSTRGALRESATLPEPDTLS